MLIHLRSWVLAATALLTTTAQAQSTPAKPRLLVTTDIGGDPDDQQSMRRLLLYANEFDITGLVASASGTPNEVGSAVVRPDLIEDIVDDYGTVQSNLSRHASGYPTAATLLSRIKAGSPNRGVANLGAGKSTAGSNHIIATVDASTAPLHVTIWGGAHDLAQALYDVRASRTAAGLATFLSRLRVYAIADQDKTSGTQGTGEWIRANFPTLRYVEAGPPSTDGYTSLFRGMYQNDATGGGRPTVQLVETAVVPLNQEAWLNANVRTGHGALGAGYPVVVQNPSTSRNTQGVKEGDTPSWFYVLPNGLQDPEQPTWGGWGGRFKLDAGQHFVDAEDAHWTGNSDYAVRRKWTVARWRAAYQNDFAARMDWCATATYANANHAPVATVDGDATSSILQRSVTSGSTVALSATGSSDPDGDTLSYQWFQYVEAGTYAQAVTLTGANTRDVQFTAPTVSTASTVHLVLAVKDNGSPALTRYRRVVVTVQPSSGGNTSLRGYWRLDEGQGGTTSDGSSYGQSGTLLNGPVWAAGHAGSAVEFDGVDDRIDLANPTHLRLTGAMTLSAWVFIDTVSGNGRIVNKQGPSGSRGWSLNVEAGGYASFQVASSSTQLVIVDGASTLPTGQWVHLAGTYQPGVALRLYVNGVQDGALTTGVPAAQYNPGVNAAIGNRPGGGTPFNGRIDEVRVYDRVLSAAELQQL
ncbi:DUF1593 domain-containing protein [Corallococcus exiguus]|uniref:nucleoside hydrolase-like domain-containing protein n=1 Tax=Corallococcus exiguus TaxID=83462 RepID=UPI001A8C87A6|nr:DUF1593 domain-containing protein [Corallococcus exiguus]